MRPQTQTALEPLLLDPKGPSVTAIGGGHGQAAALEAIQCYAGAVTALVAVGDDGGSSGRLSEMGFPPPGDVRRCLLALTPDPSLWSELFAHRFMGGDVAEHSLGNLILAGLAELFGDFDSAVAAAERMLGTLGRVIPVAREPMRLIATIDGVEVAGQETITKTVGRISGLRVEPEDIEASPRALQAVAEADQIVIGPGSLYTSLIAAMKVGGLADAVMSARAQRVFVLNLVDQDGETMGMNGIQHLDEMSSHIGLAGPGVVVVHDGELVVPPGHSRIELRAEDAAADGWRVVFADVADMNADWPEHDPLKLGLVLEDLIADSV